MRTSAVALLVAVVLGGCVHRGVTPIRTHFNKGVYHYSTGDYDAAISEYRRALEEDPADRRSRFNLAEALEAKAARMERGPDSRLADSLRQEAVEHYQAILRNHPEDLRATVNLAARDFREGQIEAGESRLAGAIEAHPRAALPRLALASHRLRQGRREGSPVAFREAVGLLEEALDRDPSNVDANMLLGHAYAGLALLAGDATSPEDVDRARQAYLKALESDPFDLGTLMALARLERQAGEPETAARWLGRVLNAREDHFRAHLMLSEVLDGLGDLEGATTHLWRARELEDPRRPRLSAGQYRERLLDLYRRLLEVEGGG